MSELATGEPVLEAATALEGDGRRLTFHALLAASLGPAGPFLEPLELDRQDAPFEGSVRLRVRGFGSCRVELRLRPANAHRGSRPWLDEAWQWVRRALGVLLRLSRFSPK